MAADGPLYEMVPVLVQFAMPAGEGPSLVTCIRIGRDDDIVPALLKLIGSIRKLLLPFNAALLSVLPAPLETLNPERICTLPVPGSNISSPLALEPVTRRVTAPVLALPITILLLEVDRMNCPADSGVLIVNEPLDGAIVIPVPLVVVLDRVVLPPSVRDDVITSTAPLAVSVPAPLRATLVVPSPIVSPAVPPNAVLPDVDTVNDAPLGFDT